MEIFHLLAVFKELEWFSAPEEPEDDVDLNLHYTSLLIHRLYN